MSVTYKMLLWKPLQNGNQKVKLRVTVARQQEYIETGVEIAAVHWNDKADPLRYNWVRATHPEHKTLNGRLRDLWREVQSLALGAVVQPAREIKRLVESRFGLGRHAAGVLLLLGPKVGDTAGADDFLAYFADELKRRAVTGNPRSVEKLEGVLQKIRQYLAPPRLLSHSREERQRVLEQQRLPFAQLTGRWVRDYADHLAQQGNKPTTVNHNLDFVKTVVRRAIEDNRLKEEQNPFKHIRIKEPEPTPKIKLTAEQVEAMEGLEFALATRGSRAVTNTQLAREAWLLQFFLLGARVGDVVTLRWGAVGPENVTFYEQKTNKLKYAPRHRRLDAVLARLSQLTPQQPPHLDDFVLPFLSRHDPYAQYPPRADWHEIANRAGGRAQYMALLRRIESATGSLNAGLKKLAPLLGLEPRTLTSHTARHSFANAGRVSGLPATHLRDLLNHHSVALTETYMGELAQGETLGLARQIYGA